MYKNKITFSVIFLIALCLGVVFMLSSCSPFSCSPFNASDNYRRKRISQDCETRKKQPIKKCIQMAPAHLMMPASKEKRPQDQAFNTEEYKYIADNDFLATTHRPLSTFSVDVDTASYSNIRRFLLQQKQMPPKDAVRIEECINYFRYNYPEPNGKMPLKATVEMSKCPWNSKHNLLLIGLQAKKIKKDKLPPSNFVFLVDTSGSMQGQMPLLKRAMSMLTRQMRPVDRIAIVAYAGSAGLVLPSTSGKNKEQIIEKINSFRAGGCTAGAAGIKLAYQVATENFLKEGNNRVVLITDGDFNVGTSSEGALVRMIEEERKKNIFLTVLGVGYGNYKDNKMEMLADKGNGNYAYIDSDKEAKKVLVNEMSGNMFTVAKDVKIQIEFNPQYVKAYRLIGYVNRKLNDRDFADDKKDAGEVGVGHQVTALYEIVPGDSKEKVITPEPLEYQKTTVISKNLLTLKLRWKAPDADKSQKWVHRYKASEVMTTDPSSNLRFAAAVAEFGMLLRDSTAKGTANWSQVMDLASEAKGDDAAGYRAGFIDLVQAAQKIKE
jgi:Ca-activated chloride channel homolog